MNTSIPFQYPAAGSALTEALVRDVVLSFYDKVRRDSVLGPVFAGTIGAHWDEHIERIILFWLSATRLRRGYDGRNFMPAHLRHRSIQVDLLPRWLELFRETVAERCSVEGASVLNDIAVRMAETLAIGLAKREQQPREQCGDDTESSR
jgi:hemoglobin